MRPGGDFPVAVSSEGQTGPCLRNLGKLHKELLVHTLVSYMLGGGRDIILLFYYGGEG